MPSGTSSRSEYSSPRKGFEKNEWISPRSQQGHWDVHWCKTDAKLGFQGDLLRRFPAKLGWTAENGGADSSQEREFPYMRAPQNAWFYHVKSSSNRWLGGSPYDFGNPHMVVVLAGSIRLISLNDGFPLEVLKPTFLWPFPTHQCYDRPYKRTAHVFSIC